MTRPNSSTRLSLTAAKSIASMGVRWVPAFLPTLERAFGATTGQLTAIMGFGELSGLSTIVVGRHLDRGRERLVMQSSLCAISFASFLALVGTLTMFAVAFVVLLIGAANMTVAAHAWLSKRVAYSARARAIGTFELGWALALLIGGPVAAVLIEFFGWRGPFIFVGALSALAALLIAYTISNDDSQVEASEPDDPTASARSIPRRAWLVIGGYAFLATAGLTAFVVTGTWLEEAFGVSTGGIGAIALGLGTVELAASSGSAGFADRLGKQRSTLSAEGLLCVGLIVMVLAGDRLVIGVLGLVGLLLGFEYAIVTSFSLISESMPDARGRVLAMSQAVGTFLRGLGVVASGWLFDRYGISGTAVLSGSAAVISIACFSLSRRGL